MLERLRHMLIKEFIQTFRDPRMRMVLIAVPIIQSLVFGYAVTTDVKRVPIAIADFDNSKESRELIAEFLESGYFHVTEYVSGEERARRLVDRGKCRAVLWIHKGFAGTMTAGRTAQVQFLLDGTDSNTAGIILNYANQMIRRFNQRKLEQRIVRATGLSLQYGSVVTQTRAWFNENLESRHFYVPGVIALLIMLVTLMLSSMAIVREKEIGTIEQIVVTPIRQLEFILGKTIPFALIGFLDVLLITITCVLWFEVPIRGSISLLLICTSLYLMSTLGMGLLISTVSRTQQQAMMTTFLVYFPSVLLSGFMFPIANMPTMVQWLTYGNPLRYFLIIIRGIFLKDIGADILWPQMTALAVLGTLTLLVASRRFKKTVS